jgi:hypothetical protein
MPLLALESRETRNMAETTAAVPCRMISPPFVVSDVIAARKFQGGRFRPIVSDS